MASTIKTIRLKRGQTLTEVARAIGTDAGNLSRVENGKQNPSPRMAARLAKYFGYEITEIQILYPERFVDSPAHSS
jgi:transcriptional regulator with XRE-family HTH domain